MKTILISGGMDSFISSYIIRGVDLGVYVDLGTRYSNEESKVVSVLEETLSFDVVKVFHRDFGQWEKNDAEIPNRNLFLAMTALNESVKRSSRGQDIEIYFAFQEGEQSNLSRDRSKEFCQKSSDCLTYMSGRTVKVDSACWNLTKVELVKWYIDSGYDKKWLYKTFGCYYPNHGRPCGDCGACFRRVLAFVLNGMVTDVELTDRICDEYESRWEKGKYFGKRREEMRKWFSLLR